ncbi:hypothetical protein HAX54_047548, partial [Datura stramonium]|nr:hypothetical protein [Datura stramonium]
NDLLGKSIEFEYLYARNRTVLSNIEADVVKEKAFLVDDYGECGILVRCPLPPANYSAVVNLRK